MSVVLDCESRRSWALRTPAFARPRNGRCSPAQRTVPFELCRHCDEGSITESGIVVPRASSQEFLHVLGEDVDLDVDTIARLNDAQSRDGQGMRNQHDRERVGPDVNHGEADSIDGDRPFGDQKRCPGGLDPEGEELPFPLLSPLAEDGGCVDMP